MDTQTASGQYLLLFRGHDWDKDKAPEELQHVMGKFMAWMEDLKQSGKLLGAQPLGREGGRILAGTGKSIADGPFSESKEAIGGYFLLQVDNEAEAVAYAKDCPILVYEGVSIEVRPVAEECATMQRVNAQLAQATA